MHIKVLLLLVSVMLFGFSACAPVENSVDNTDEEATHKFLGTWNVSDLPARINYIVEIKSRHGYDDQVILENFADMGNQVVGLVVTNTIVIDQQSLGSNFSTEGSGVYISADKLEFDFILDDGIDVEAREADFTK